VETMPSEDFCGSVTADLNVSVDGKSYSTVSHRFGIERYVEALVAVCKIPRGQPVNKSDVKESKFEQSRVDSGALTKVQQAAGLLAVRTIYPGTVLRVGLLTPPPIIRKGQTASVVWEGTGFNITTKGEILEDGCANELVRVRLSSKKIVKAVVLDAGTLQIAQ
jgi:flagella basal body P-ring formation protein FlgA